MYGKSHGNLKLKRSGRPLFKKLGKIIFLTCVGLVSLCTAISVVFPKAYETIIPYRFHCVLTNSMEPTIPTNSLVLVKAWNDPTQIKRGHIIVFWATRFGEKMVIMHRFSHTQWDEEGELIYRTHPEQSSTLDIYATKGEDILGVYVWHIPYAGKLILFLKSPFGLVWLCQILTILLINTLLSAKWAEQEKTGQGTD